MAGRPRGRAGAWWAGGLLVASLMAIYVRSPQHELFDAQFTLLTTEALLTRASWDVGPALGAPFAEEVRNERALALASNRRFSEVPFWQLEPLPDGRIVYRYPPGTSLFSLPFVALARPFGGSTLGPYGLYDRDRETALQTWLAALLAALVALIVQRMALRELPWGAATTVALVAGLGGPLWSTASRCLWPQTWTAVWVALALLELLRWEDGERQRPELLALYASAAFWARPTAALFAAPIALYVALRFRRALSRLLVTGALALAAYGLLSKIVWSSWVPAYTQVLHHGAGPNPSTWRTLIYQLVSVRGGVIFYSPIVVAILLALAVRGVARERRPFAILVLGIWIAHVVLYTLWRFRLDGTASQRFLTELTPCIAWLGAHAWRRARDAARERPRAPLRLWAVRSTVAFLALASVAAHATGALYLRWPNLSAKMRQERQIEAQGGPPATTQPVRVRDELPQRRLVRWLVTEWWPGPRQAPEADFTTVR